MPHMPNILIIEDEPSIAQSLEFVLQGEGLTTTWRTLAHEGIDTIRNNAIALVILDIGLPDMTGFEACKKIREFSDVPIIFLTARSDEIDRIVGLEIGADDYVVKPFSPREVAARVKAILKRTQKQSENTEQKVTNTHAAALSTNDFIIDHAALTIRYMGKAIDFTKAEYLILYTLLLRPGQVFSRGQLLESIDSPNQETYERTVDSHIKTLRAKLRRQGAPDSTITTVRGFGYRFEGDACH